MNCKNIKYPILFSFLFFAGSIQGGYAQEASDVETGPDIEQASFTPPFDFPIVFSGNFGEIRSNHFHGGLDFKTGGAIGKPVHALADGHISRIRVTHGSGYVLDVDYDNGYSTINRHLSAFVGDIARRVKDLQYEQESWEVEIIPEPGEYPVKAGQVIALSGNTGYSFGPHLHLDMIESATGDYVDPLPFFMEKVKDNIAPRAEGIILFPQPGKGVVNGKQIHRTFPVNPTQPITAWGLIGAGIRAYDHMDGVGNRYGVHTVILEVDGEEVFPVRADSGDVAFTYQLHNKRVPLHGACEMRIGLRRDRLEDKSKYYVAGVTARGGKYSIGGTYEDGFMKVRIRDLGTYTVAVDTVPPEIIPLNPGQWGRTGRITLKAKDKETGINSYLGTIDGKYALFGKPNSISGNLVCELDPKHVKKGGRHTVEMTVTDGRGNRTTEEFHFVW